MKNGILLLALGSLLAIGLVGCASEEAPAQTSAPATEGVQNDATMESKARDTGAPMVAEPPK